MKKFAMKLQNMFELNLWICLDIDAIRQALHS